MRWPPRSEDGSPHGAEADGTALSQRCVPRDGEATAGTGGAPVARPVSDTLPTLLFPEGLRMGQTGASKKRMGSITACVCWRTKHAQLFLHGANGSFNVPLGNIKSDRGTKRQVFFIFLCKRMPSEEPAGPVPLQ